MSRKSKPKETEPGQIEPAPAEPRMEQTLLQLVDAAGQCEDIRQRLASAPPPDTETLIQLHRVLVYNLLSQPEPAPEVLDRVEKLMKTVLVWDGLEEKRRICDLAEQKYRDQVAAQKALEEAKKMPPPEGGISEETMALIERELNLF